MSIYEISTQLYGTAFSTTLRAMEGLVPMLQSFHIIAIAFLLGSVVVMDLHLVGLMAKEENPRAIVKRYFPWLWWSLAALAVTGSLMVIAEPIRELTNSLFWTKMSFVAGAVILTLIFRLPLLRADFNLERAGWRFLIKPSAILSLVVWVVVIFCGRWIAYSA